MLLRENKREKERKKEEFSFRIHFLEKKEEFLHSKASEQTNQALRAELGAPNHASISENLLF